jgi:hypothetical protein
MYSRQFHFEGAMFTFLIALFLDFSDFRNWFFAATFLGSSHKDGKGSVTGLSLDLPCSLTFKPLLRSVPDNLSCDFSKFKSALFPARQSTPKIPSASVGNEQTQNW